jgi:hypothetical protein
MLVEGQSGPAVETAHNARVVRSWQHLAAVRYCRQGRRGNTRKLYLCMVCPHPLPLPARGGTPAVVTAARHIGEDRSHHLVGLVQLQELCSARCGVWLLRRVLHTSPPLFILEQWMMPLSGRSVVYLCSICAFSTVQSSTLRG